MRNLVYYKVELKTITKQLDVSGVITNRYPAPQQVREKLFEYIDRGNGIVVLHDSFYDFQYDTKLSAYHSSIDSKKTIGHIKDVTIEDGKLFVIIELNDDFDPGKSYICYYRANLESDPRRSDRTLKITNLFAVDLITIADKEKDTVTELSYFEPCEYAGLYRT